MKKTHYWFVTVHQPDAPCLRYIGHVVIGENKKTVKHYFNRECHMSLYGLKYKRVVEIPEKVYLRLSHIYELKHERDRLDWINRGGDPLLQEELQKILNITKTTDGLFVIPAKLISFKEDKK